MKVGKKIYSLREPYEKQQGNEMEGTKYSQHNQTDNITCMIILSHITRIL